MSERDWIILLLLGAVAGWAANKVVNGGSIGLIGDVVVGILGAFIGNWALPKLGLQPGSGISGFMITATLGAIILLLVVRVIRKL